MNEESGLWRQKGETLSDVSAEKEYGISRKDIYNAINQQKLQFREGSMHGNPWFRLLRQEVETLVLEKFGEEYLKEKKVKKELLQLNRELKTLKARISEIEKRKSELQN